MQQPLSIVTPSATFIDCTMWSSTPLRLSSLPCLLDWLRRLRRGSSLRRWSNLSRWSSLGRTRSKLLSRDLAIKPYVSQPVKRRIVPSWMTVTLHCLAQTRCTYTVKALSLCPVYLSMHNTTILIPNFLTNSEKHTSMPHPTVTTRWPPWSLFWALIYTILGNYFQY